MYVCTYLKSNEVLFHFRFVCTKMKWNNLSLFSFFILFARKTVNSSQDEESDIYRWCGNAYVIDHAFCYCGNESFINTVEKAKLCFSDNCTTDFEGIFSKFYQYHLVLFFIPLLLKRMQKYLSLSLLRKWTLSKRYNRRGANIFQDQVFGN